MPVAIDLVQGLGKARAEHHQTVALHFNGVLRDLAILRLIQRAVEQ
jgi:hypothetical protein